MIHSIHFGMPTEAPVKDPDTKPAPAPSEPSTEPSPKPSTPPAPPVKRPENPEPSQCPTVEPGTEIDPCFSGINLLG